MNSESPRPIRVAILHPWFPQYRSRFFELIIQRAQRYGFEIEIFHGETPPEWNKRADSVTRGYATELSTKFIPILGKHLIFKDVRPILDADFDLIVVEHAVRNLETYYLLIKYGKSRIAYWGHGRTYTRKVSRAQEMLKFWLARRSSWFFAYTSQGAKYLTGRGLTPTRITTLNNSIDVTELKSNLNSVSRYRITDFSERYDLRGRTALFIGGLDSSKRLQFLLEASDLVHSRMEDFRLLVCGAGELEMLVNDAARTRQWMHFLGPLGGEEKAIALASSQVIAMPGRVGLVAIDSFVAGIPVVTTNWRWHAPEFEYLKDRKNAVITQDSESEYADGLIGVLSERRLLSRLQRGAIEASSEFSVEAMVDNFVSGLVRWKEANG